MTAATFDDEQRTTCPATSRAICAAAPDTAPSRTPSAATGRHPDAAGGPGSGIAGEGQPQPTARPARRRRSRTRQPRRGDRNSPLHPGCPRRGTAGTAALKLLRSPHAHARIALHRLNRGAGSSRRGGRLHPRGRPGTAVLHRPARAYTDDPDDTRVLDNVVRFIGQRVAAVVADSVGAAEAGVRALKVEYELLDAVFTPAGSHPAPGAPAIHGEKDAATARIARPRTERGGGAPFRTRQCCRRVCRGRLHPRTHLPHPARAARRPGNACLHRLAGRATAGSQVRTSTPGSVPGAAHPVPGLRPARRSRSAWWPAGWAAASAASRRCSPRTSWPWRR